MKLQYYINQIQKISNSREKIIPLHTPDPDIPPHKQIIGTLKKFSDQHNYSNSSGLPKLKELISKKYDVKPENVLVGCGSRHLYFGLLYLYKNKKVLIPDPEWAPDLPLSLFNLKTIRVKWLPNESEKIFAEKLSTKIRRGIALVILSNPNNPTGRVLSKKSIQLIHKACRKNSCLLIEDRAYEGLSFKEMGHDILSTHHIIIGSFSKTFSMSGYRIGYIISKNKKLLKNLENYIYNSIQCLPVNIQNGACTALQIGKQIIKKAKTIYKKRLSVAIKLLVPSKIFYIQPQAYPFLYVSTENINSEIITEKLLKKGIAVAPSTIFSKNNDFIRISLVTQEFKIRRAMIEIVKTILYLKKGAKNEKRARTNH